MKAALAGRQDKRLVIVGRTSAMAITGVEDTIARLKAYEAAGVDMLFMAGVKTRAQLDAVAAARSSCRCFSAAPAPSSTISIISARAMSAFACKATMPFMAAVNAVYETLKALRAGTPPANIKSVASPGSDETGDTSGRLRAVVEGVSERGSVAAAERGQTRQGLIAAQSVNT